MARSRLETIMNSPFLPGKEVEASSAGILVDDIKEWGQMRRGGEMTTFKFDQVLKVMKVGYENNLVPELLFGRLMEELLEEKCPLYNKEQKSCLVYDNRPLSCRTYPLEFDGKNFSVVDVDCPGVGEEGMTKEELKEMRETAKLMNYELTRMRIALPVLNQLISSNFMKVLMKQQMEAMSKMSDEDKAKLDEIFKKDQAQE